MVKPLKPHQSQSLFILINHHINNKIHLGSLYFSTKPNLEPENHLISKVCEILCSQQWRNSSEMMNLSSKLKPPQVIRIIEEAHSNITESVLQFFYWVSKRPFYKHDINCYMAMLNRLLRDKQYNAASADHVRILMIKACRNEQDIKRVLQFFNEIKGLEFTLYSFNTLLIQLGKFGMVFEAQNVYKEFLNSGIKSSLLTFNTMINILCKKGKVQEAEMIFSRIYQYEMCPDVFTYTSLILGHCRNKNLDAAFAVFDRMVKEGIDPNSVTYNTLVNGLCNVGNLDEALGMLDEMIEKNINPTVYTYTVPVTSLCASGRVKEAIDLVASMKKRGCDPNVQTYTALISGLAGSDKLELGIGFYHKMLREGLVPTTVTYNALINALCATGKLDDAVKLFHGMKGRDILPNTETYNAILKGFCQIGDIETAMTLFSTMLKMGPPPTVITFNTLINGYLKKGFHNNALRLLHMMDENGCQPDQWTYAELISGLCTGGELDLASNLFQDMLKQGLIPNQVNYTTLIDGLCKEGKIEDALSLFERMQEAGCDPTTATYNAIINGMSKENRFSEAEKLCSKMAESGLLPNVITYTTLIDGLCKNGGTNLAFKIFHEMENQSCFPNLYTYSSLIYGLCLEGQVDKAEELLEDMKKKGLAPDQVTYTSLIDGLVKKGRLDDAFTQLRRMVTAGCQPNYRTYSALVKGLQKEYQVAVLQNEVYSCSSDSLDALCNLIDRISEIGNKEATVNAYNTLIAGLCRESKIYEADKLVAHMRQKGLDPDYVSYCSLLGAYCKNLRTDSALEIFDLLIVGGHKLPLSVYRALICALCKVNRINEAEALFTSMLDEEWNPDEIVWTILLDGLLKERESTLCMKLLHVLNSKNCSLSPQTYDMLAKELSKIDSSIDTNQVVENIRIVGDEKLRKRSRIGHANLVDGMLKDGLWDVYNDVGMKVCAETHNISREEQDNYAIQSFERGIAAQDRGAFQWEIVPVEVSGGRGKPSTSFDKDEGLGMVNIPHNLHATKITENGCVFDVES